MIFPIKKETKKSFLLFTSIVLNLYLLDLYRTNPVREEVAVNQIDQTLLQSDEIKDSVSASFSALHKDKGVTANADISEKSGPSDKSLSQISVDIADDSYSQITTDSGAIESTRLEIDFSEFDSEVLGYLSAHFDSAVIGRYFKIKERLSKKDQALQANVNWDNEVEVLNWQIKNAKHQKQRISTFKKMFGPKAYADLKEIGERHSKEMSTRYGVNIRAEI